MSCETIWKRAADRLDWRFNLSRWLPLGDHIESVAVDATDVQAQAEIDGPSVVLWLAGGEPGKHYAVDLHIHTEQGRAKTQTVDLHVR